jgi:hypothetical protein
LLGHLEVYVDKLLDWDMDGSVMGRLVGDLDGLLDGDFRINLMGHVERFGCIHGWGLQWRHVGGNWVYYWTEILMATCWGLWK